MTLLRPFATLWWVITLVFIAIRLIPGDPVDLMLADDASAELRNALRAELGTDQPIMKQYAQFLFATLRGDWGRSYRDPAKKVTALVTEHAFETFKLGLMTLSWAWLFALVVSMWIGEAGSEKRKLLIRMTWIVQALPSMWVGPLMIVIFGWRLGWFPIPGDDAVGLRSHALPSFTLGLGLFASSVRYLCASIEDVSHEPYVVVARAKGVPEGVVQIKHVLRNALLPLLPIAGAQLGAMLSGAVVVEKIFNRKGLGTLFLDAFFSRDFPVLQGCVGTTATLFVIINVCVELMYRWIDPRTRNRVSA